MITKELVDQWAQELGCEIPTGPDGVEFFFYPKELLDFAQRAADHGAAQREAELTASCISGAVPSVHWVDHAGVKQAFPLNNIQDSLAASVAAARLQGAEEERALRARAIELHAKASLEQSQRITTLERVNQGLLEALEYIDSENASEEVLRRARAAIAAAEKEKTK